MLDERAPETEDGAPRDAIAAARALEDDRESAEAAQQSGRYEDAVLALSNQARAAIALGRLDLARALLDEAGRSVDTLAASPSQVHLGIHVAKSYEALAKASPALRKDGMLAAHAALLEAYARARKLGSARAESFALGNLGALYQLDHRSDEALVATRRAARAAEKAQAPDALYRWSALAAQLLREQGRESEAIASYQRAEELLGAMRAQTSPADGA